MFHGARYVRQVVFGVPAVAQQDVGHTRGFQGGFGIAVFNGQAQAGGVGVQDADVGEKCDTNCLGGFDHGAVLGGAVDNLQIVLVSVDPNRDTPKQLKQYLGYFDPQFIGLTASSVEDLQKLANAVSIPFIPADTSKPNYTVDHSGNLAVIGPDGTQRGFIRAPLNNQKLVMQLPEMLKRK